MISQEDLFEYEDFTEGSDDFRVSPEDFKDIFVIPADWTVSTLRRELDDIVELDPDFQRRSVWSIRSKSKFIESLVLGIPIPQILLAESKESRNSYLVLDGKQRLLTIKEFFSGKLATGEVFKLTGLDDVEELNGKTWSDISMHYPREARSIEAALIRTAIIRGWQNDNILYEIFHRLNSGSVRLSPMELRMSLIRGPFIKEVINYTSTPSAIHRMLGLSSPDKRMKDVEIAIRHLAFQDPRIEYRGDLKAFLDDFCRLKNSEFTTNPPRQQLGELIAAIEIGLEVFPEKSFARKFLPEERRFERPFNRAVFDVLAGSLVAESVQKRAVANSAEFVDLFKLACEDERFRKAVETTTKSVEATRVRFEVWYGLLWSRMGISLHLPRIAYGRNYR